MLDNYRKQTPIWLSRSAQIVPLHDLTGILRLLLKERVPVSDLRRTEVLPPLSARNLSIEETAEALRPELQPAYSTGCPAQHTSAGHFDGEFEHLLINMQRQSPDGELIWIPKAQRLLKT